MLGIQTFQVMLAPHGDFKGNAALKKRARYGMPSLSPKQRRDCPCFAFSECVRLRLDYT